MTSTADLLKIIAAKLYAGLSEAEIEAELEKEKAKLAPAVPSPQPLTTNPPSSSVLTAPTLDGATTKAAPSEVWNGLFPLNSTPSAAPAQDRSISPIVRSVDRSILPAETPTVDHPTDHPTLPTPASPMDIESDNAGGMGVGRVGEKETTDKGKEKVKDKGKGKEKKEKRKEEKKKKSETESGEESSGHEEEEKRMKKKKKTERKKLRALQQQEGK